MWGELAWRVLRVRQAAASLVWPFWCPLHRGASITQADFPAAGSDPRGALVLHDLGQLCCLISPTGPRGLQPCVRLGTTLGPSPGSESTEDRQPEVPGASWKLSFLVVWVSEDGASSARDPVLFMGPVSLYLLQTDMAARAGFLGASMWSGASLLAFNVCIRTPVFF